MEKNPLKLHKASWYFISKTSLVEKKITPRPKEKKKDRINLNTHFNLKIIYFLPPLLCHQGIQYPTRDAPDPGRWMMPSGSCCCLSPGLGQRSRARHLGLELTKKLCETSRLLDLVGITECGGKARRVRGWCGGGVVNAGVGRG